ncbi:MAG: tRNA-dihydrouridine synthase family protein [Verrucomicrobiae bacterium]|nr:tRNA-dihydrouridine synthase family protein [Verrucomicrobiae bacterium]
MFEHCEIQGIKFEPARFCAPMAGYTHSAFRRLVSEFGGCGAFWTEMLSARQLINEDFQASPWLKRKPSEKFTVYQLMVRVGDQLDRALGRLEENGVEAIDINFACDAPHIRSLQSGSALFGDIEALKWIISNARQRWNGLLFVKIRLGDRKPQWQGILKERLELFQDYGANAVIVHPRFFEDKFKRSARHDVLGWISSIVKIPIIASGDITCKNDIERLADRLSPASAIMLGRITVVKPWIFAAWDRGISVDYRSVWVKMRDYILEDFEPLVAISRLKMFTKYYSANFLFGRHFYTQVYNAKTIEEISEIAEIFFSKNPQIVSNVLVANW